MHKNSTDTKTPQTTMHRIRSYRTLHVKYILASTDEYYCFNVKERWLPIISALSKMAL